MTREVTVTIPHNHPSLAGHFPNNPVVPGVVILGQVLKTLREGERHAIKVLGSPSVKFLSPLRPGEALAIRLETDRIGEVAFTCSCHERMIAVGRLEYHVDSAVPGGEQ